VPASLRIAAPGKWLTWIAIARLAVPGVAPERQERDASIGLPPLFARAQDVTDSGLAFTELATARDTVLLGEPFVVYLRFGFERETLRTGLVQLFPRPLDVPVQVFAPALEAMEGIRFLAPSTPESGASFVLNEDVARARPLGEEERAGRTYAVFELERSVAATQPGELVLAAPLLGFAHATRFREDFVSGSVPLDRADAVVRGRELRLTILPPPEEGRPADFSGAVGRFTIRAEAEPRELDQGQSLRLTLAITGQGDLSRCSPPDLAGLDGLHLQGSLVERSATQLEVVYDLAPQASASAVPPIRFSFFDTTPPAGYRTIETDPIAIVVRPRGTPSAARPAAEPEAATDPGWWIAALIVVGLALAVLGIRRLPR
jgi:hypothetical protein